MDLKLSVNTAAMPNPASIKLLNQQMPDDEREAKQIIESVASQMTNAAAGLPDENDKYRNTVKSINLYDVNPNAVIRIDSMTSEDFRKNINTIAPDIAAGEDNFKANSNSDDQVFELPDWGVEEYINDRTKWLKGVRSIADEPGWFYFKVFFKFNTNFGLFGSCLRTNKHTLLSSNTALRYLNNINIVANKEALYQQEQIPMRINSLIKFVQGLSKINSHYPWMIKGVSGLDQAMNTYTNKFGEERSIDIIFNTETTDMKLISLLNLYKYACYDDINCKEIIPENLRKFDMMVVVYHVPVKYFQTAIMVSPKKNLSTGVLGTLGGKWAKAESIINKTFNFLTTKSTYYKYKRMSPQNENFSNMMSFQMFTFQNCEFDVSTFGKYFEGAELKNEKSFQINETPVKVKYDRVYFHNMNEWNQMLFGSDGFWYDPNFVARGTLSEATYNSIKGLEKNYFTDRIQSLKQAKDGSSFYDKNAEQYKSLIEYSESLITDGLMSMDMKKYYSFIDGNIYGSYGSKYSDYFKDKLTTLKTGNIRGNLYGKSPMRTGSEKNRKNSIYLDTKLNRIHKGTIAGNIYEKILGREGTGGDRINSEYLSTKIKWLNDGEINDNGVRVIESGNNGELVVKGELSNLFKKAKDDLLHRISIDGAQNNAESVKNLFDVIQPSMLYERDPVKTRKKEIWNYALTGAAKSSSIGGVLDAAQKLKSFWSF